LVVISVFQIFYVPLQSFLDNKFEMERKRLYGSNRMSRVVLFLWGMFLVSMLTCCDKVVIEPEIIETIELHSGYSVQLPVSSHGQWFSNNTSVATVSSSGLVTAVGAGKAFIYTYSSSGEQHIFCYIEVNPKRNILFYIATDADATIDGDSPGKIQQIRSGWEPEHGEMLIYVDRRGQEALLLRMNDTLTNGYYGLDTLENYGVENSADAAVLQRMIDTLSSYHADSYGLIFFSHASGWLPAGTLNNPRSSEAEQQLNPNETELRSIVIDNGGGTRHEMEYYDFAAAIPDHMFDFIILEACLMGDVMSMYELRNKTDYVLVSSAEIVAPGFTHIYKDEIMRLYDTKNPVLSVVSGFAQSFHDYVITHFPENSAYCSSTLGLIQMNEMQHLATSVKAALNGVMIDETTLTVEDIQQFDRPNALISSFPRRSRYFDLDHVIENLASASQYDAFRIQMEKTVVWKANTSGFMLGNGGSNGFTIERHCGLTTYIQQSVYPVLNAVYEDSSWYKAIY